MISRVYLIAEGLVDLAFLSRLLDRGFGLRRVEFEDELGEWERFQRSFAWPRNSKSGRRIIGNFTIGTPEYLRADSGEPLLVLLRQANGDELWKILDQDLEFLLRRGDLPAPDAIAIFGDADSDPAKRLDGIRSKLRDVRLDAPAEIGYFGAGNPRVGVYLFPGGSRQGTIEENLLALGQTVYPRLRSKAAAFVEGISNEDFPQSRDRTEFAKRAGRQKAVVGAMTALLQPGHATPRTLRNDRWLDPDVVASTPDLEPCIDFLSQLLGRSPVAP